MQWLRWKSYHEFYTSPDYLVNSKPASATQCDSISKTKAKWQSFDWLFSWRLTSSSKVGLNTQFLDVAAQPDIFQSYVMYTSLGAL